MSESSYISALPFFMLGCGLTLVPELSSEDARELAGIILEDKAVKKHRAKRSALPRYVGKHIAYTGLGKWLRGSDKVDRVYASVKLFMRARLLESDACREVAKILRPRLGKSKRGRPAKKRHRRRQRHEIVRSICNSFARRNQWPPSEDSASFVDSRAEFWYQYAVIIREWRKGRLITSPPDWKPAPAAWKKDADGGISIVPFPQEAAPGVNERR